MVRVAENGIKDSTMEISPPIVKLIRGIQGSNQLIEDCTFIKANECWGMGHHHKFGLHEAIPKPIEGGFEHLVTEWIFYHGNSSSARTSLRLGNTRAVTGILVHSTVDTETPPCWDEYVQVDVGSSHIRLA